MADKKIYDTIETMEPINKGLSGDKKYCATVCDGTNYLLRIMPIEKYETWKNLFAMLERVATLGVPMCKSVELGTCDDGVYVMQDWVDGEDLFAVLPTLSESEQYVLGIEVGKVLHFATGQIRGYFGGEPPAEFFKLIALYIATYQLGHVSWAQKFGESAMNAAKKDNEEALRWFDNINNPMPTWYLKNYK